MGSAIAGGISFPTPTNSPRATTAGTDMDLNALKSVGVAELKISASTSPEQVNDTPPRTSRVPKVA